MNLNLLLASVGTPFLRPLVSIVSWSFYASPRIISCSSRILFRSDSPVSSSPSLAKGERDNVVYWKTKGRYSLLDILVQCRRFRWNKTTSTLSVGMSKLCFGTLKVVTKSSAGRAKLNLNLMVIKFMFRLK